MNNNYRPSLEQLVRYLKKESDVKESEEIVAWLRSSEQNRYYLVQLESEWTHLKESPLLLDRVDRSRIWTNIQERIQPVIKTVVFDRRRFWWMGSAAALFIFLLGTLGTYFIQHRISVNRSLQEQTIAYAATGQKSQLILPDGTRVWLNAGTKITYSQAFNQQDRKIILDGEAFFEVVKKEDLSFIVETSHLDVEVKGTAFDVSAYADDDNIVVSLLRGKVAVKDKKGFMVKELLPNEYIQLDKRSGKYSQINKMDALQYSAWTSEELVFDNEPLDVVLRKLERWYGVNINWEGIETQKHYTFKVKTENLREILELMNVITPIQYTIKGKSVDIVSKK
ncbi:FecR domain-containing protein [Sphingobacterium sp. N143]|uniref:FecR family protein n=1 Tax=Sphingobacterium sp. N143 TaxID=2746727 RepID=UPI002578B153|nr:FecR family protein [Sphingobacterium sp. N143]MDM1294764.1 FecR domain-containing protein [Sphingobacterium sp. N143]